MLDIKEKNIHRPLHYYGGQVYFLSATCYEGVDMFCTDNKKRILKIKLKEISEEMGINIYGWVILNNHYHLLFHLNNFDESEGVTNASLSSMPEAPRDTLACVIPSSKKLSNFIRRLHSITSKNLNEIDNTPGRKVWYQYWDYCVRNEIDFWKHFNYILKNPLKHKLAKNIEESFKYKFSSNPIWLEKFGFEGLEEGLIRYKVKEVWYDEEDE